MKNIITENSSEPMPILKNIAITGNYFCTNLIAEDCKKMINKIDAGLLFKTCNQY